MVDKRALIETIEDFDALDNLRRSGRYIKNKLTRKKPVVKLPDMEVTGQYTDDQREFFRDWRKDHPVDGNQLPISRTTRHTQVHVPIHTQKYYPRINSTGRVNRESEPKVKQSVRTSGIPGFMYMVHHQRKIRRGR